MDFKNIITIIDSLDPPKRIRKINNLEVLEEVLYLLKTGIQWSCLRPKVCSRHAVYKRFRKWIKDDIFNKTWIKLLQSYSQKRLEADKHWFKELFIDTTMVKNVYGSDCVGKNPTDRGRKATKVSMICDKAGVPIALVSYPANVSDICTIVETVKNIPCRLKKDKRYSNFLVGDKGYVSKVVKSDLKKDKINLVTPIKKRSKNKLSKDEKSLMYQRHKIENLFCRLDKFKRLFLRQERQISCFEAFNKLAMTLILILGLINSYKNYFILSAFKMLLKYI
jgi:transposase